MDRANSSRMLTLFQTLEKLSVQKSSSKLQQDDLQQLRYTTSKIQQYVATQEKVHRDLILKNSTYLDLILTTFESCSDTTTQQNIIAILNELIGKTNTGKKASTLVAHGTTHTLFQVLVYESRDSSSEELLLSIHQILAKLGPKDRKFGVKARLTQALGVTLNLLKTYISNTKVLLPVITVIKLYSNNAVNASYLGKNGCVSYLFKVLSACGRKHLTLVKYALDSLALLVKSKSNSARAIGQGGVPVLLNMFYDWHKVDSKNRHINLRKAILTVLKHLTNLKSGRKALMDSEGIRILYTTCHESNDCRELETLIFGASIIMRKCFPKNRLPLTTLRSTLACELPESDFHVIDSGEGHDKLSEGSSTTVHPLPPRPLAPISPPPPPLTCRVPTGEENGYESSLDHDDDLSSDDDNDAHRAASDEEGDRELNRPPATRDWDDLMQYKRFFSELYEFDGLSEEPSRDPHVPQSTHHNNSSSFHTTQSTGSVPRPHPQLQDLPRGTRYSVPNLSARGGEHLDQVYRDINVATHNRPVLGRRRESDLTGLQTSTDSSSSSALRTSSRCFIYDNPSDSYFSQVSSSPTAVNMKTGSSVFSLDFSNSDNPASKTTNNNNHLHQGSKPVKLSRKKQQQQQGQGGFKMAKASSGNTETDKRGSKSRMKVTKSDDDWLKETFGKGSSSSSSNQGNDPAFCVTPLLTSRLERPGRMEFDSEDDFSRWSPEDDLHAVKLHEPELFTELASKTRSVGRFNKVAFPELNGHEPPPYREPLYEKLFGTQRQKIFEDIDRFINPDQTIDEVVYDLDSMAGKGGLMYSGRYSNFTNNDQITISRRDDSSDQLRFNAQFESGNLRKAIQIREHEYDLILNPDVNTNHHHQWFYFQISHMQAGRKYRFNIVNCEKINSQFNFGMKPVMFSVMEASQGRPNWTRVGSEICYYKNHFVRSSLTTGGARGKSYYTATFTIEFPHKNDVCYLAYHYPYTYTMLQYHMYKWEENLDKSIYFKNQVLTQTLGGNPVPVITITSLPVSRDSECIDLLKSRPYIFLSSRVHPGESNASWVMKGTIDFLLSDTDRARALRDQYIFKIVPMLNPDGVINGTHRCSLVAEDLNRRWLHPCPKLHPTIYHCKGLLQFMFAMQKTPLVHCFTAALWQPQQLLLQKCIQIKVYCDYHGHSRRKNVFLYGCSPSLSWMTEDTDNPAVVGARMEDTSYKTLPRVLQSVAPSFSLQNCSFMVEKSKETTARVIVWRQIRVVKSYTMESSYCGCDQGPYKGSHITTRELEEMGAKFCEGLLKVRSRHIKMMKGGGTSSTTSGVDSNTDLSGSAGLEGGAMAAGYLEPLRLTGNSEEGSEAGSDSDNEDDDDEDDDDG